MVSLSFLKCSISYYLSISSIRFYGYCGVNLELNGDSATLLPVTFLGFLVAISKIPVLDRIGVLPLGTTHL